MIKEKNLYCFRSPFIQIDDGFFLASEDLGRMFGHSFLACAVKKEEKNGDKLAHTNSTLYTRISPQWLSEPRRLCSNVP